MLSPRKVAAWRRCGAASGVHPLAAEGGPTGQSLATLWDLGGQFWLVSGWVKNYEVHLQEHGILGDFWDVWDFYLRLDALCHFWDLK